MRLVSMSGHFTWTATRELTMEGRCDRAACRLSIAPHPAAEIRTTLPFAPSTVKGLGAGRWRFDAAHQAPVVTLDGDAATGDSEEGNPPRGLGLGGGAGGPKARA
jgi:hypothetical protein